MKRIICIGNRYVTEDAAGPRIYDELIRHDDLPADIEIIDGSLGGLNLLPFFETSQKIILVDQVKGPAAPDGILILDLEKVAATSETRYDHSAGVAYLLKALTALSLWNLPEIVVVGITGIPDDRRIQKAAAKIAKIVQLI